MIAAIDHDDLGIAVPQRFCRCNSAEASSHDHDSRLIARYLYAIGDCSCGRAIANASLIPISLL